MSRHLFRLAPLVLLLLGIAAMLMARDLTLGEFRSPGPGLWPFLCATLLALTALVLLVVDDPEDYEPWTRGTVGIGLGLVSLAVFIVLFQEIGFLVPAVLMLLVWLRLFAREPWRWALPLAVIGAVVFHLVFVEALGVPFPDDIVLGG
ncbi:tripartite tricarboxylate transporter TctB family protein [Blastococcus sp. TML/M2B]|uniref:tripartite tricarboxylate transporter TctB family protein n=1 Tax=unclassified Blastococcus TaxID=2619396 RepID=UPI00190B7CCB|nr:MULTISPECIES: tripartite tricarboxylate transporter TctB family protein [unclassified Blastococcus]MBN1091303.1 tripartite tricarboxylate transporter TctB family protein [Blastococcus sp. TML/M2B]MBN1095138.1 tripartite tricarboxylate transporter TctB family protein [Blastococcus sp. TML/C7B]